MTQTIEVFGDERSGNCLKVKWVLDHTRRVYRWNPVDIMRGQSRTPEFLAMNPAGQVPAVVLDGGRTLAQSNAIVMFFAEGTPLLPQDTFARAKVLEWLFWEQYSHEPYVAVVRFQRVYLGKADEEIEARLKDRGNAALLRMERHLAMQPWLVGEGFTAADLCLLPYTKLAPEGGFDLARYPAVADWVRRAVEVLA
jgi:glutathione S-transferase